MAEFAACKNGVSSLELSRKLQISYKAALFMNHRIRHAAAQLESEMPKIRTVAEADESYVGGRPRGHEKAVRGRGTSKQPVAAVLERGGAVRTQVIARVNSVNLKAFLDRHVSDEARLDTDTEGSYQGWANRFKGGHNKIHHGKREYARGDITTNRIEGFFSRVKRSINGTYHAISREHLHRYLSHAEFSFNSRKMNDGERTEHVIQRMVGKRMMYKDYVAPGA